MSVTRQNDNEEGVEVSRPDDTPVAFQAIRAADAGRVAPGGKGEDEKLSIFWRVFGGTLLSIVALVAVTLYNNLNNGIAELRAELTRANEARAAAVVDLRTDLAKTNESRGDMVRKEEFATRMTSVWDRLTAMQAQSNTQNATLTGFRTEMDGVKERVGRAGTDADALRKDLSSAAESMKKDLAGLDVMKERVAAMTVDLKADRDELLKLRTDADKNHAYDLERRDRRDAQYKQLDENLKELQKAVQDCREKMARLEGQYTPPATAPVTPAGATSPVAPPKKSPPAGGVGSSKVDHPAEPKSVICAEEEIGSSAKPPVEGGPPTP